MHLKPFGPSVCTPDRYENHIRSVINNQVYYSSVKKSKQACTRIKNRNKKCPDL
jgi:hypothetical protein